ncbi:phosphatase PAP2 family protein [Lactobacillaceae bacterium L1_55_11]|nr:phosphatase PAP2 family protein [Lactobacillaceae bacterium L1_55_11]
MIIAIQLKQKRRAIWAAILVVVLAVLVGTNTAFPNNMDESVRQFMASIQSGYGDVVMSIATFLGSPVMDFVYVALLALVLILAGLYVPAIWTLGTIIGGQVVMAIIKTIIHRERPLGHLLSDNGPSFPSQHVFGVFVVAFLIMILVSPNITNTVTRYIINWLVITIALMTALSRMYLGAHFFTDVIAGFLFAYVWVTIAAGSYPKFATYLKDHFKLFQYQEI